MADRGLKIVKDFDYYTIFVFMQFPGKDPLAFFASSDVSQPPILSLNATYSLTKTTLSI